MKRFLILTALFLPVTLAQAQIARWLIKPAYESIDMLYGTEIFAADSAGSKVLFSPNGRRLCTVSDRLWDFNNHFAITTTSGSANISSIVNDRGGVIPVSGMQVAANTPAFHDGYILVFDGQFYRYMGTDGQVASYQLNNAYPYSGGYASCMRYFNQRKQRDPINMLIDRDLQPVPMRWDNREFNYNDIEFISSVNEEGVAFVVAKGKLYSFNGQTKALSPVFARDDETNSRNQAKLSGSFSEHYQSVGDTCYVLTAQCGRHEQVAVTFSRNLLPLSIRRNDSEYTYRRQAPQTLTVATTLIRSTGKDGEYGINTANIEVLPPQFQDIPHLYGDRAVVKLRNRCGLLRVYPNDHFQLSLNGGNDIAFRHRTHECTIRLNMPAYIPSALTTIDVEANSGITIDKARKEGRDTPEGNFIEYPCVLTIPGDITETPSSFGYPMQVVYDGLRAPETKVNAQAWHYNYYTVTVNEQDASISQGTLTATFDVSIDRRLGDPDFPKTFDLQTNGLTYEIEQVSESRYKCKLHGLQEGNNTFKAVITEEGCPPLYYEFEVEYTRPTTRTSRPTQATVRRRQAPARPTLEY